MPDDTYTGSLEYTVIARSDALASRKIILVPSGHTKTGPVEFEIIDDTFEMFPVGSVVTLAITAVIDQAINTQGVAAITPRARGNPAGNLNLLNDDGGAHDYYVTPPNPPELCSALTVTEGDPIPLTAKDVEGGTFSWTGPDTFTSSDQSPTIAVSTLAMDGTYSCKVTVNGVESTASTVDVTVSGA